MAAAPSCFVGSRVSTVAGRGVLSICVRHRFWGLTHVTGGQCARSFGRLICMGAVTNAVSCFAIMPFAEEFDDVYTMMQFAATAASDVVPLTFVRLDEIRSAGRISTDLIAALESSALCVADLTGLNANVMWEVGYAMAFQKPILLLTQDIASLPFDVRDFRTIAYRRAALSSTLRSPLAEALRATLRDSAITGRESNRPASRREALPLPQPGGKTVFLSFSVASGRVYFEAVSQALREAGFEVVTAFQPHPDDNSGVLRRIRWQLSRSSLFVAILTKDVQVRRPDGSLTWAPSVWAMEEKGMALGLQKPTVLMVEEGIDDDFWRKTTPERVHHAFNGGNYHEVARQVSDAVTDRYIALAV